MKIYILKLQQGKYYVGKTNKPTKDRVDEHRNGNGTAWTKKYPPLHLIKEIEATDCHRENNETLNYMEQYGIENVRGGIYSKVRLSAAEETTIQQHFRHNNNRCLKCGRTSHFANECYASTHVDRPLSVDRTGRGQEVQGNTFSNSSKIGSSRCGRQNHRSNLCRATTHVNGYEIDDNVRNDGKNSDSRYSRGCSRCGRPNHSSNSCYATKHVNGRMLDYRR
jgi:GAG-polyprotein viral zinc-finger/GIY-YIG catalytic domain